MSGWTKGMVVLALVTLAAGPAVAGVALPLGGVLYRPGSVPAGGTAYGTQLPAYCVPGNLVDQLVAPMQLPPSGPGFTGTVTSTAYRNPGGGLTFTYVFANTGPSTDPVLVVAGFLKQDWLAALISDAGSNGTGSSGTNDTAEWNTGDPHLLFRGADGLLEFDWQIGTTGTVIGPSDVSATIWLETDVLNPRTSVVGLADGGAVGQAAVLVAPEPATVGLVLLGGVLVCGRRGRAVYHRRQQQRQQRQS